MSEEHILIVEDDETIHNMIDEYLEKDYICVDAYSGTEARLILQHTEVSLVLLDLMLPGVSGEQLLRELKQKQLPVIVLSAKDGIDDRVALLNEGADDYLCKPFDLKELKARIQVQLRKRMSKQEHAIAVDGVVLLPDFCHLEIQGMKIRLTRHEYRILELLMRDVKRARTKKESMNMHGKMIIWEMTRPSMFTSVISEASCMQFRNRNILKRYGASDSNGRTKVLFFILS